VQTTQAERALSRRNAPRRSSERPAPVMRRRVEGTHPRVPGGLERPRCDAIVNRREQARKRTTAEGETADRDAGAAERHSRDSRHRTRHRDNSRCPGSQTGAAVSSEHTPA
jgi:hypothetical protein